MGFNVDNIIAGVDSEERDGAPFVGFRLLLHRENGSGGLAAVQKLSGLASVAELDYLKAALPGTPEGIDRAMPPGWADVWRLAKTRATVADTQPLLYAALKASVSRVG